MNWTVDPRKFATDVRQDLEDLTFDVAKKVFDGVVEKTPVYSGQLLSSWHFGPTEVYKDVKSGTFESPVNQVQTPTKVKGALEYYITNGKPYARIVESGGPKNKPRMMVQRTLADL